MASQYYQQQQPQYVEEYACEQEQRGYGAPPPRVNGGYDNVYPPQPQHPNYQRNERLGELGAVAAGAFALYEGNEAKVDHQHARRHKYEEEAAGLGGLASAGYAYHEHREKKKFENEFW